MERISKELVGASAIPIILSLLEEKDTYGYEIMQKVKKLSLGRIEWKEGSLYPVLKKLEALKMIKSYWKIEENQRPRKYYTLLDGGKMALVKEKEEWDLVGSIFNKLWNPQSNTI